MKILKSRLSGAAPLGGARRASAWPTYYRSQEMIPRRGGFASRPFPKKKPIARGKVR